MVIEIATFALGFCAYYCTKMMLTNIYHDRTQVATIFACIISGYLMSRIIHLQFKEYVKESVSIRLQEIVDDEILRLEPIPNRDPGDNESIEINILEDHS